MHRTRSLPSSFEGFPPITRSQLLVAFTALLAVPIAYAASLFPVPYMLPAFGIFSLMASIFTAALAWLVGAERSTEHATLWDVSGAFGLIGIGAVLISRTNYPLPPLG